jgi:hypothetical protein
MLKYAALCCNDHRVALSEGDFSFGVSSCGRRWTVLNDWLERSGTSRCFTLIVKVLTHYSTRVVHRWQNDAFSFTRGPIHFLEACTVVTFIPVAAATAKDKGIYQRSWNGFRCYMGGRHPAAILCRLGKGTGILRMLCKTHADEDIQ